MNPVTFWAAAEALGTIATAFIAAIGLWAIKSQIKEGQRDASRFAVEGYDWLLKFVTDSNYDKNLWALNDGLNNSNYDQAFEAMGNILLYTQILNDLIEQGFINEPMIIKLDGPRLSLAYSQIQRLGQTGIKSAKFQKTIEVRTASYRLLQRIDGLWNDLLTEQSSN